MTESKPPSRRFLTSLSFYLDDSNLRQESRILQQLQLQNNIKSLEKANKKEEMSS